MRGLLYPVPDPAYPFLGVHFTNRVGGGVDVGPNAVLAFAREGYRRRDVSFGDLAEALGSRGFRALARANWRMGARELRGSLFKSAFAAEARRYVPEVTAADLVPAGRACALRRSVPTARSSTTFASTSSARSPPSGTRRRPGRRRLWRLPSTSWTSSGSDPVPSASAT